MIFRYSIGICAVLFVFVPVSAAQATMAVSVSDTPQDIVVTIQPDYSATATWHIQLTASGDGRLLVPEFESFGEALSTRYKLVSAFDETNTPNTFFSIGYDLVQISRPTVAPPFSTYTLNYVLTPYFKAPVAMYELWLPANNAQSDPTMRITYPRSWKILTLAPAGDTSVPGTIVLKNFAQNRKDADHVTLIFQTNANGIVQQVGKYTVTGPVGDVEKLTAAIGKIPFVDTLMQSIVGIQPPEKVTIVADDLTQVGQAGYEIDALAARPHVIVFNNQIGKNKSTEEIAEILAHELLHLAMDQLTFFGGRFYDGAFFNEGVAVYFQTAAHRQIYSDINARILNEGLDRTFVVSPSEAKVLYESNLDTAFDGTRNLGTSASYRHAGLVFGRFADTVGVKGFTQLFTALQNAKPFVMSAFGQDSDTVLTSLTTISGLSREQLVFPGRYENDISGIVGRISRPENDEDMTAELVSKYIQNNVSHYFAGGIVSAPILAGTPPQTKGTVIGANPVSGANIARLLTQGITGLEVVTLQTFLESKGFLTMPANVSKGYFGPSTRKALMAFQKSVNLVQTGSTGPKTRALINAAMSQQ